MLLSQDGFESDYPEVKFQTITFYSQFEKATVQKSIAELQTVTSSQMIRYQLLHTQFDQISDYKHDSKLSTKLLVQAANKNTNFMFMKTRRLLFSEICFQKRLSEKNSKQTLQQVENSFQDSGQLLLIKTLSIRHLPTFSKTQCGRVSSNKVCRFALSICSLHVINRNYSNTFLLIKLQKAKFCPK